MQDMRDSSQRSVTVISSIQREIDALSSHVRAAGAAGALTLSCIESNILAKSDAKRANLQHARRFRLSFRLSQTPSPRRPSRHSSLPHVVTAETIVGQAAWLPRSSCAGLSSSTVQRVHAALHAALRNAVKLGLMQSNPTERVDAPRNARFVVEPFTAPEARQLLEAAHGERLEALYVLALTTGARLGELLGLTWNAVSLDGPRAGILEIRASLRVKGSHTTPKTTPDIPATPSRATSRSDPPTPRSEQPQQPQQPQRLERWELGPTKTSGSHRTVHLPPLALDALRAHRARQLAERLAAGSLWEDRDLVFCDELGGFLDKSGVSRYSLHRILEKAGLPRKRFHDLRHTAATLLLETGVGLKAVAGQLGHASISTTGNVYGHITRSMRDEVASALGDALDPAKPQHD